MFLGVCCLFFWVYFLGVCCLFFWFGFVFLVWVCFFGLGLFFWGHCLRDGFSVFLEWFGFGWCNVSSVNPLANGFLGCALFILVVYCFRQLTELLQEQQHPKTMLIELKAKPKST